MAPHLKLSQTCFPSSCCWLDSNNSFIQGRGSDKLTNWQMPASLHGRLTDSFHLFPSRKTVSMWRCFFLWQCIACARRSSTPLRPRSSSVWRGGSTLLLSWFQVGVHDITRASNSEGIKCPAVILVNTLRPCACRWVGGSFFQILFVLIQSRNKQTSPSLPHPFCHL